MKSKDGRFAGNRVPGEISQASKKMLVVRSIVKTKLMKINIDIFLEV